MGCKNYKHSDSKTYFIPNCWSAVIHGKHACICNDFKRQKLSSLELIKSLIDKWK